MKVLGNPLLGRNFSFYGLRLNDDGLYYINWKDRKNRNSPKYEIFITSDPVKILAIMDLKFEDVDKANKDEFFKIMLDCPYFKTKSFTKDVSKGYSKMLVEFAELLKHTEYDEYFEHINIERIIKFFGEENDFKNKYEKSCVLFQKTSQKRILTGELILKYVPDFDKTRLCNTFTYFNHFTFEDELERDYFITTTSEPVLVNKFLEQTKMVC